MTRSVSPDPPCPLELARRVFARWRSVRAAPDEPVPAPLLEIAQALLGYVDARRIAAVLELPVDLITGVAPGTGATAFVALPATTTGTVPVVDARHDVAVLDALVIIHPDGTRVELRGRVPVGALAPLVHGPHAQAFR